MKIQIEFDFDEEVLLAINYIYGRVGHAVRKDVVKWLRYKIDEALVSLILDYRQNFQGDDNE